MQDAATESPTLSLGSRSVLFVGGKGGVGKTTTAAALALRLAEGGERILLVSTDPAHSLGDLFGRPIGDREVELFRGEGRGGSDDGEEGVLVGLEIDPDAEVDRYLEEVRSNMRSFVRPAMFTEIERQIDLTRHSPGAAEAALMDRVADLMHRGPERFDRVIFDTAPTGHTLRLLTLPELMSAWTDGMLRSRDRSDSAGLGLRRLKERKAGREGGDDLAWFEQPTDADEDPRSRKIREILLERQRRFSRARRRLLDDRTTAFLLVLVPEKLPILESRSALEILRKHRVPVAGLIVNRVLPDEPTGSFLEGRRAQEAEYLARIDREFGDLPRIRIPLLARDVEGFESLRTVAGHLRIE